MMLSATHVGSFIVISPDPLPCVMLGLLDRFNDVLIKPFMSNSPIVSFCIEPENFCSGIMKKIDTDEHGRGCRCEAMDGTSEERVGS